MGSTTSALKDASRKERKSHAISTSPRCNEQASSQSLGQWKLLRVIGKGAFGKVRVVQDKKGNYFALKYINKETCIARQSVVNVLRERAILAGLDHPLVMRLHYAFQDTDHLYFVSELLLGGDLRYHIVRFTFTEEAIRHWIAEIASALAYVHERGIVHRDVKPDNVLLDVDGHAKLADFNVSTQARLGKLPKSRSGSLLYMAPEVYRMDPYDGMADYWSLGVTFYECIFGLRPFHGNDAKDIMSKAHSSKPPFPEVSPAVSPHCISAISALLEVEPHERLGNKPFAQHPFFSSLSWNAIDEGKSFPIYKPAPKSFDVTWELEDLLLEESPLDARRFASRRENSHKESQAELCGDADMHALLKTHFADYDRSKTPRRVVVEPVNTPAVMVSPNDTPDLNMLDTLPSSFFPVAEPGPLAGGRTQIQNQKSGKGDGRNWLLRGSHRKKEKIYEAGILLNKPGGRVRLAKIPP